MPPTATVWSTRSSYSRTNPVTFTPGLTVEAASKVSGLSGDQLATIQARLVLAVAAVLTLAALAGYSLSLLVGRRISVLASTAASLARGDLHARAPRQRIREFAVLGDSLNRMAGRIEEQVDEITSERDRARVLISSLVEGVVSVSDRGEVTLINPAARRLLGLEYPVAVESISDLPAPIGAAIAAATPMDDLRRSRERDHPRGRHRAAAGDRARRRSGRRGRGDACATSPSSDVSSAPAGIWSPTSPMNSRPRWPRSRACWSCCRAAASTAPTRRSSSASMEVESDRLERLVEEQLQLARLDSGAVPLEREHFDLDALVDGVVASRLPLAEAAGVTLRARNDGIAPVDADPARVEQILLILLDNALRHTPAGGSIIVSSRRVANEARLEVADTGEGIPAEDQPFVFDRFYRGDPSREGRSAGLGLAIARGLAEAHGGRIDLVSAPGVGSTFTLHIPNTNGAAPGYGAAGAVSAGRARGSLGA